MHEARLCPIGYGGFAAAGKCTGPALPVRLREVLMGEYAGSRLPWGERTFFRGGVGSGVQQYSASLLQKFLPAGIFRSP